MSDTTLDAARAGELALLEKMIRLACAGEHGTAEGLCEACAALLAYAARRLARCPYGADKPVCRQCPVHCYRPAERARIKAVMRYAGPRLLLRGDLGALRHLAHGLKKPPERLKGGAAKDAPPQG
jgi:hypothetical protein